MKVIVNKLLLAGAQSMLEMHLIQPRLTYILCWPKNKEMMKKR